MQRSQRSDEDFKKTEQVRRAAGTVNDKNRIFDPLAWIGSKLRDDAVNDWVEDVLR